MAKIYYRKIMAGEMTIEDVPERWKEEVRALLDDEPSVN
jgi:Zn-dependent M32 family carboxypeptidase